MQSCEHDLRFKEILKNPAYRPLVLPWEYAGKRADFLSWWRPQRDERHLVSKEDWTLMTGHGLCAMSFAVILWFSLHNAPARYPHFTLEEIEVQRGWIICLGEDFESGCLTSRHTYLGFSQSHTASFGLKCMSPLAFADPAFKWHSIPAPHPPELPVLPANTDYLTPSHPHKHWQPQPLEVLKLFLFGMYSVLMTNES